MHWRTTRNGESTLDSQLLGKVGETASSWDDALLCTESAHTEGSLPDLWARDGLASSKPTKVPVICWFGQGQTWDSPNSPQRTAFPRHFLCPSLGSLTGKARSESPCSSSCKTQWRSWRELRQPCEFLAGWNDCLWGCTSFQAFLGGAGFRPSAV